MDEQEMDDPKRMKWLARAATTAGVCAVVAVMAISTGGVAVAQTDLVDEPPTVQLFSVQSNGSDDGTSASEEAVFDRFEQCLEDSAPADPNSEFDESSFDALFESCEAILQEIEGYDDEAFSDLSPEDQEVFDEHEQCLDDAFADLGEDAETELSDEAIDALVDSCDSILDGLSEEFGSVDDWIDDLPAEDQAVFDRYDGCLVDGGIDELLDGGSVEPSDGEIDALFDSCDPILDELSEEGAALLEDCPEDEDGHEDSLTDA